MTPDHSSPATPPLACQPFALTPEERGRYAVLRGELAAARLDTEERPGGYAVCFPPSAGTMSALAEFISLERRCCPFLTLGTEWAPDGPIRLLLSGPDGAGPVLQAELGALLTPSAGA